MVAAHTQATQQQWQAIANVTRSQACAFLSEYTVPLAHALQTDLHAVLQFICGYVRRDPCAAEAEQTKIELTRMVDEVADMLTAIGTSQYHPTNDDADEQDCRKNVECLDLWSAFTRRLEGLCTDCSATFLAQYKILGGYGGFFGERKPLHYIRTRYGSIIRVRELLVSVGAVTTALFEQEQAASRSPPIKALVPAPPAALAFWDCSSARPQLQRGNGCGYRRYGHRRPKCSSQRILSQKRTVGTTRRKRPAQDTQGRSAEKPCLSRSPQTG
jgi:hypothetical protein